MINLSMTNNISKTEIFLAKGKVPTADAWYCNVSAGPHSGQL